MVTPEPPLCDVCGNPAIAQYNGGCHDNRRFWYCGIHAPTVEVTSCSKDSTHQASPEG